MYYGKEKIEKLYGEYNFAAVFSGPCSNFISGTSNQVLTNYNGTYSDPWGGFNNTNGTYTIPKSGLWLINFTHSTNDNSLCDFNLQVNGLNVSDYCVAKSGTSPSYWFSAFVYLSKELFKNDVVRVYCTSVSGPTYDMYGMFVGILTQ